MLLTSRRFVASLASLRPSKPARTNPLESTARGTRRRMATGSKDRVNMAASVRQVIPENLLGYVERLAEESAYNSDKAKTYQAIQFPHRALIKTLEYADELAEVAKMDVEMEESADKELREEVMPQLERMSQEICDLLLMADKEDGILTEYDQDDATLEVRAGAGGQEAGIFAHEIFQLYCGYSRYLGFDVEVTERQEFNPQASSGKEGSVIGVRSAVAVVSGSGVFRALKYECGVHRVQRVPITGTNSDRLQTSTCSVAVVPLPRQIDIVIPKSELKYESMRSSGAGGQNVNKVNSACRLTHLPTGVVVNCEEQRSLAQNESKALFKLKQELYRRTFEEQATRQTKSRKFQIGNMDRNEKIRTYNYSRNSIADHRGDNKLTRKVASLKSYFAGDKNSFDIIGDLHRVLDNSNKEARLKLLLTKRENSN